MRIRTTTEPGASPPPGLSENRDRQQRPRWAQMGTLAPANVRRSRALPLIIFVPITGMTGVKTGDAR